MSILGIFCLILVLGFTKNEWEEKEISSEDFFLKPPPRSISNIILKQYGPTSTSKTDEYQTIEQELVRGEKKAIMKHEL